MSKTRLFVVIAVLVVVVLLVAGFTAHTLLGGGPIVLPHGLGRIG